MLSAKTKPKVAVFATTDDELFAIDAACPHAGHALSRGFCVDPTDIEDLFREGEPAVGIVVSCPAHSYIYDLASGDCVVALGGGPGRCVKRPVKVDGETVYVRTDLELPGTSLADLSTETRNAISMRVLDRALDAKYGAS